MNTFTAKKPILITTGEPAGIGMDIILILASQGFFQSLSLPVVVLACDTSMRQRWQQLKANFRQDTHTNLNTDVADIYSSAMNTDKDIHWQSMNHSELTSWLAQENRTVGNADFILLDIATSEPVQAGQINSDNAAMVLEQLKTAHNLANAKQVLGIVTAPIQKSALIDANLTLPDGSMFSGHTEYFMQMSNCAKVVMMLANETLKVALVTTHLPIAQVAAAITKQEVRTTVEIVLTSLREQFAIAKPRVLVCGLNPHAGEGGHLGMEEIEIINPVLHEFQQAGHDVSDAMPADTLYTPRHLQNCDATIAMYHDQGLPVLKSHGFGDSVNITLGLPYIRTSVDHGTALDKAATGDIDVNSLKQAISILQQMSAE